MFNRLSGMSCFFFFSSRRRHTRSKRDWSSDVCSSDLPLQTLPVRGAPEGFAGEVVWLTGRVGPKCHPILRRSEERRVGKECRSRWWGYHSKKKVIRLTKVGRIRDAVWRWIEWGERCVL